MEALKEKQILLKRAEALSLPVKEDNSDTEQTIRVLEFRLTGERYGISISFISETIHILDLTMIPGTPAFVQGVMNVRGRIIPVIDLKQLLHLEQVGISASTSTIILRSGSYEVAFLADAIEGIRLIPVSQIKPVPLSTQGVIREFLIGVAAGSLVIIDGEALVRQLETAIRKVKQEPNP